MEKVLDAQIIYITNMKLIVTKKHDSISLRVLD